MNALIYAPTVLAMLPRRPDAGQAATFILAGFLIVLFVLGLMWLGTALFGQVFKSLDARAVEKTRATREAAEEEQRRIVAAAAAIAATTRPAPQPTAAINPADDPQLVAILAAAAHVTLGRAARIVSIRPAQGDWSAEGRRQIFASRRVR